MAKDARDRFATAGELAAAASAALGWAEPKAEPAVRSLSAPPPARAAAKPYTRADYRRALVLNAMTDSLSVAAAAVILIAGILFGALALAVPLAIVVYAGGAARAFFDDETAARVLERERANRHGALEAGDAAPDTSGLTGEIRVPLERAHAIRRRIHEAIERADMPYDEVSAEVDQLVATMEKTAKRAQLLHEGLDDAPPADIEDRLERLRARNHPSQRELMAALEYQLTVQRRMEQQLERFHDQMDRMLVELDTVRGNLISASASEEAYQQKRVAAGIRELRDEMGLVAEGVAAAYEDQEDASSTLERVTGDG
jgi:hypothetical protein